MEFHKPLPDSDSWLTNHPVEQRGRFAVYVSRLVDENHDLEVCGRETFWDSETNSQEVHVVYQGNFLVLIRAKDIGGAFHRLNPPAQIPAVDGSYPAGMPCKIAKADRKAYPQRLVCPRLNYPIGFLCRNEFEIQSGPPPPI